MRLQDTIDEALAEKQKEREQRIRSGAFSPSMFGRCYRAQIYNRQDVKHSNPVTARSLRIFKVGHLYHDFVQWFFHDAHTEVKCTNAEGDVFGYADIVTEDSVVDIKSTHSFAFNHFKKDGYDVSKEKESNWLQVAWYSMSLGKERCRLVFVSRDDLRIKEFDMPTEKWFEAVLGELRVLRGFWEKSELPPPIPRAYGVDRKTGKPNSCEKYCNFRDTCFKEQGKEIK